MDGYKLKVFRNFDDDELRDGWMKLQSEIEVFPQMYFEWVSSWFRHAARKEDPYIICVLDGENNVVGVAPFILEKIYPFRILRSIPIHFGDFYEILATSKTVSEMLVNEIDSFKHWNVALLFNVNSSDPVEALCAERKFSRKEVVRILAPVFDSGFNSYLSTLSKNSRQRFNKNVRKLERLGKLSLKSITTWDMYISYFNATRSLFEKRWAKDGRPLLTDDYYEMRNEALHGLFEKGKAALFVLELDDKLIAYRLGFLNNRSFYDWKVCHDTEYNALSPGFLSVGMIIERLIDDGYISFNFMAGDYQYKRSWNNVECNSVNLEIIKSDKCSIGYLYFFYRYKLRDSIKKLVSNFFKFK